MTSEELMELVIKYNEGCKQLLGTVHAHINDPIFETEDGKMVLEHLTIISQQSTCLNLKAVEMALTDILMGLRSEKA